jgi:hypothetical protein
MAACNLPHAVEYPAYCQLRRQLVSFFTHIIHYIFPRLLSNEYLAQKSDAYNNNKYLFMQILSLGVTTSISFERKKKRSFFD